MSKTNQAINFLLLDITNTGILVQPGVQGSALAIYRSIFGGEFGSIGPAFCKAFISIGSNCLPKMFPLNHYFPSVLKDSCAHIAGVVPGPTAVKVAARVGSKH
ncbi:hypothetical protein CRYUN_Cryun26dG0087000 [Craigia yunnanensis]